MKTINLQKIRIGFIGLNHDSHWASRSHIPALKFFQDDFEITGVANSTYESAKNTAEALRIPLAFENPTALINSSQIDLVVITVKVAHHFSMVKAALEAGKHVYCEHPLGNGLNETKELAELAAGKNLLAVVGMQMTVAPEVVYLKRLINDGYIGKILSSTLIGSGTHWRDVTTADLYYMYDKVNGATMLTIPMAHTLSGLTKVLGSFDNLKAIMISNYETVKITDTDDIKPKTAEDQIMVIGKLKSGAAISIHYRAGSSKGTNLLWEINGTLGDILVTAPLGVGQIAPLTIKGAKGDEKEMTTLVTPANDYEGLPDNPMIRNVALVYKNIAADIKNNTRTAPTFDDALALQKILNLIEESAKSDDKFNF